MKANLDLEKDRLSALGLRTWSTVRHTSPYSHNGSSISLRESPQCLSLVHIFRLNLHTSLTLSLCAVRGPDAGDQPSHARAHAADEEDGGAEEGGREEQYCHRRQEGRPHVRTDGSAEHASLQASAAGH